MRKPFGGSVLRLLLPSTKPVFCGWHPIIKIHSMRELSLQSYPLILEEEEECRTGLGFSWVTLFRNDGLRFNMVHGQLCMETPMSRANSVIELG
jgi:hypothetical protein